MPSKPLKTCLHSRCPTLTREAYCPIHQKKQVQQYDRERGSSTQRGYDAKWRKARIGFLKKHPLCKHCYDKGLLNGATRVDHLIAHKGDKTLFWDRNNWQPLCEQCHNRKTAREDRGAWR
nr:HNH endonuclease [Brevibacillus laterosporus]